MSQPQPEPQGGKHNAPDFTQEIREKYIPHDTPKIDVTDLAKYPEESLRQVVIELRVKQARVNAEYDEIQKALANLKTEAKILNAKFGFYQTVIRLIQKYLKENQPCQEIKTTTTPEKS